MFAKFYGLRGEPFLLTPDPTFYFESKVHSEATAHLNYGLNRGEGFIIITGDIGAGKTTIVKRLLASIDQRKISAAHVVTTLVSGSDLIRLVAAAFGLKDLPADKSAVLLRLQAFFESSHRDRRRLLLLVDEAQNLTEGALEELRMLSNFQIDNAAPFQSFLIGQPQFRTILASPNLEQLRQRVIAAYHLGPMSREECGEYLLHRLRHVGWEQDPFFTPSAIDAIFEHSGGVPRRINTLCNRLMLLGFLDELHRFERVDVDRVAEDLARENGFAASPAPGGIADAAAPENRNVAARIAGLEDRVAAHEESLRRAAEALHSVLDVVTEEKNKQRG
jgi:general secretion pathway protein A